MRGRLLLGFARFVQRHYDGMLPNVRDAGVGKRQVEELAEVAQANRSQVLQLKYR